MESKKIFNVENIVSNVLRLENIILVTLQRVHRLRKFVRSVAILFFKKERVADHVG